MLINKFLEHGKNKLVRAKFYFKTYGSLAKLIKRAIKLPALRILRTELDKLTMLCTALEQLKEDHVMLRNTIEQLKEGHVMLRSEIEALKNRYTKLDSLSNIEK